MKALPLSDSHQISVATGDAGAVSDIVTLPIEPDLALLVRLLLRVSLLGLLLGWRRKPLLEVRDFGPHHRDLHEQVADHNAQFVLGGRRHRAVFLSTWIEVFPPSQPS